MGRTSSITGLIAQSFRILFVLIFLISWTEVGITGEVSRRIASIGKAVITEKEISYKVQIEKAYGNEGTSEEAALVSLVNDAVEYEVATLQGVNINAEEMESFKRHVDEQTRAPEILQRVKLLFGDDRSSYERIYLAPKMMNWKLRDFYSRSPEIHKRGRSLIERGYRLAITGKSFEEAAQEFGIEFSAFEIETKGASLQSEPLIPILDTLFPGDIHRNIVEDDYRYRIIKLMERSSEAYSVEAITVNKRPFDEWFKEEAAKVEIEIVDQGLRSTLGTKYPGLWWAEKLRKGTHGSAQ